MDSYLKRTPHTDGYPCPRPPHRLSEFSCNGCSGIMESEVKKESECNLTSLGELALGRKRLLTKATLFGGVL